MTEEEIKNKLICILADGASVNFGRLTGALTSWSMWLTRFLLVIHCMNHRLELAMKDSFFQVSNFNEIKEMLGHIFCMFKISGKVWRVFRVLVETIGVFIVRFVKADGTRFQQHVYDAMKNFMRNFVILQMFAENAKGSKKLLTSDTKRRLVNYQEKWLSCEYMGSCYLFQSVLNETQLLSNLLQTDDLLVYEVYHNQN